MQTSAFRSKSLVTSVAALSLFALRPAAARAEPPPSPVAPIELRDLMVGTRHGVSIVRQVPFQAGVILDGARLYQVIGREDLVRAYEEHQATKTALESLGAFVALVGFVAAAADKPHQECGVSNPAQPIPSTECHEAGGGAAFAVGIFSALLGSVLTVAGAASDPEPASPEERRRLVDAFNASLARPGTAARDDRGVGPTIGAAPVVTRGGAGVSLRATF